MRRRITFAARIIAVFPHFRGPGAAVDGAGDRRAFFDGADPRSRSRSLTAGDGTERPLGPAAPRSFAQIEIAGAFHCRRAVAIGGSSVAGSRPLLVTSAALVTALGPVGPVGPSAAFHQSGIGTQARSVRVADAFFQFHGSDFQ